MRNIACPGDFFVSAHRSEPAPQLTAAGDPGIVAVDTIGMTGTETVVEIGNLAGPAISICRFATA